MAISLGIYPIFRQTQMNVSSCKNYPTTQPWGLSVNVTCRRAGVWTNSSSSFSFPGSFADITLAILAFSFPGSLGDTTLAILAFSFPGSLADITLAILALLSPVHHFHGVEAKCGNILPYPQNGKSGDPGLPPCHVSSRFYGSFGQIKLAVSRLVTSGHVWIFSLET